MNKFFRSILFVGVGLIFFGCLCYFAPDPFKNSYQATLVRQYDYYRSIKEQGKVLVIGGSSVAFGIDLDVMNAKTGRSCAELGVLAAMTINFLLEVSKCNLNPGDIVVIEIPRLFSDPKLDSYGRERILTGIGNRTDMYRYIPPRYRLKFVVQYPRYVMKKFFYSIFTYHSNGYEGSDFDDRGCMTKLREGSHPKLEKYTKGDGSFLKPEDISQNFINSMNDYVNYCKSKNVDVFFTYVPLFEETWDWNKEEIRRFDVVLSSKLNAPLITSLKDSIYPKKFVWDYPCHLNTEGAKIRSERLAEALKPYLESE